MPSSKLLPLLVFATISTLGLSIIIYISSSTTLSPYNLGVEGLSKFMELYSPEVSFGDIPLRGYDTVVLVLDRGPVNSSIYRDYVYGGGRLIILDEKGYSNDLLRDMGLDIRVSNMCVLDEVYKYWDRFHVKADTYHGYEVGLAGPCYIEAREADVLAYSSRFSYLDVDGNARYSMDEPMGSFPLIVRARVGAGEVILVGDSDFIANLFLDKGINRDFLGDILNGVVLLDLSYTDYSFVDVAKRGLDRLGGLGGGPIYGVLVLLLMAVGVAVYGELIRVG